MVTFASGTAAPESSVTRPCRMPVAVCPKAVELMIRIVAIRRIRDLDMGFLLVVRSIYFKKLVWTAPAPNVSARSIYSFPGNASFTTRAVSWDDRRYSRRQRASAFVPAPVSPKTFDHRATIQLLPQLPVALFPTDQPRPSSSVDGSDRSRATSTARNCVGQHSQ